MSSIVSPNTLQRRLDVLHAVFPLGGDVDVASFIPHLERSNDFVTALSAWDGDKRSSAGSSMAAPTPIIEKQASLLSFVNALANVTDDNVPLINAIHDAQPHANSLRDVALGLSIGNFANLTAKAVAITPNSQVCVSLVVPSSHSSDVLSGRNNSSPATVPRRTYSSCPEDGSGHRVAAI
jgi:hypothetical protein